MTNTHMPVSVDRFFPETSLPWDYVALSTQTKQATTRLISASSLSTRPIGLLMFYPAPRMTRSFSLQLGKVHSIRRYGTSAKTAIAWELGFHPQKRFNLQEKTEVKEDHTQATFSIMVTRGAQSISTVIHR